MSVLEAVHHAEDRVWIDRKGVAQAHGAQKSHRRAKARVVHKRYEHFQFIGILLQLRSILLRLLRP